MTDSTPKNTFTTRAGQSVKEISNELRLSLHANADSLFFVRLFARVCNPTDNHSTLRLAAGL